MEKRLKNSPCSLIGFLHLLFISLEFLRLGRRFYRIRDIYMLGWREEQKVLRREGTWYYWYHSRLSLILIIEILRYLFSSSPTYSFIHSRIFSVAESPSRKGLAAISIFLVLDLQETDKRSDSIDLIRQRDSPHSSQAVFGNKILLQQQLFYLHFLLFTEHKSSCHHPKR